LPRWPPSRLFPSTSFPAQTNLRCGVLSFFFRCRKQRRAFSAPPPRAWPVAPFSLFVGRAGADRVLFPFCIAFLPHDALLWINFERFSISGHKARLLFIFYPLLTHSAPLIGVFFLCDRGSGSHHLRFPLPPLRLSQVLTAISFGFQTLPERYRLLQLLSPMLFFFFGSLFPFVNPFIDPLPKPQFCGVFPLCIEFLVPWLKIPPPRAVPRYLGSSFLISQERPLLRTFPLLVLTALHFLMDYSRANL